jgi:hypothetical protein
MRSHAGKHFGSGRYTIDIDSFVPRSEIDQRFFDTPYYITPNEPVGQEAFAVIREAMRSKALVALGRIVLAKRERVMALEPYDRGLLGTTLHYPYEVRHANDYFADIPELTPAPELLRLAEHILDSKLQTFDPSGFRDRYEEALMAWSMAGPCRNVIRARAALESEAFYTGKKLVRLLATPLARGGCDESLPRFAAFRQAGRHGYADRRQQNS